MTFPADPHERSPKGDHNRRLALGMDLDTFAAEATVTPEELRGYEFTPPDGHFDLSTAQRVGDALERLEAALEPRVDNGPAPIDAGDGSPIAPMGVGTFKAGNS